MNRDSLQFKSMRGGPASTESTRRRQAEVLAASLDSDRRFGGVVFGDFNTGEAVEENRK